MEAEKNVGIEVYITPTPGMGGQIKVDPEDFYVEEIAEINCNGQNYAVIRVKKKNWDTIRLAKEIAKSLGISRNRVSFAGTKDKRAVSVQYFSIYDVKKEDIEKIRIKDVEIEFVGYSNRAIQLGDLLGNHFKIKVVNYRDGEIFEKTLESLKELGTPNFFGLQRFGSTRFVTHEVGKLILQRKYEEALWSYVAKPFALENDEIRKIREDLWNSRDAKLGLKLLPKHLNYERSLLQSLREGKNELQALLSLPKNLKMMFVHAYQSYIYNRLLSERIREFGTLKDIFEGDFASYLTFEKSKPTFLDYSEVTSINKNRVKRLLLERFAALALPLVGYQTKLEGWNRMALEMLAEDNLDLSSFKHEVKEFSSPGTYREADMLIEISEIKFENGNFSFYLPKGCYATTLLREFLKVPGLA